jgi:uncharacterized membrane protein
VDLYTFLMDRSDSLIKKKYEMKFTSFCRKTVIVIISVFLLSVNPVISSETVNIEELDINIDYSNDPFYVELWFWVVIAAILLFLLIILIKGNRNKVITEK